MACEFITGEKFKTNKEKYNLSDPTVANGYHANNIAYWTDWTRDATHKKIWGDALSFLSPNETVYLFEKEISSTASKDAPPAVCAVNHINPILNDIKWQGSFSATIAANNELNKITVTELSVAELLNNIITVVDAIVNNLYKWKSNKERTIENVKTYVTTAKSHVKGNEQEKIDNKATCVEQIEKLNKGSNLFILNAYKNAWSNYIDEWINDLNEAKTTTVDASDGNTGAPNSNDVSSAEQAAILADADAKANEVVSLSVQDYIDELLALQTGELGDYVFHKAWDPRLYRCDEFLLPIQESNVHGNPIRVPFASDTIATAFGSLVYALEKRAALTLAARMRDKDLAPYKGLSKFIGDDSGKILLSDVSNYIYNTKIEASRLAYINYVNTNTEPVSESEFYTNNNLITGEKQSINGAIPFPNMSDYDKIVVSDTTDFIIDNNNYGAQSIMNPFSLTKLMGGLSVNPYSHDALNYMYDIRDRRRYYDITTNKSATNYDVWAIHNPTIANIIKWSNEDKWGRTPYSFLDFVFNKYFGILPTNRLITLRRYTAPTYDNLLFDTMFGDIESVEVDQQTQRNIPATAKVNAVSTEAKGQFAPVCTIVTYGGGESGNNISDFLNFKSGINWGEVKAGIHDVTGNEADPPEAVIDKMFSNGASPFNDVLNNPIARGLGGASMVAGKIMSFGKFALALNDTIGTPQDVIQRTYSAQSDPYKDGPWNNRILGPLNKIDAVKKREPGIIFDLQFLLKVSYEAKSIAGINPKAALLDCLGNAMEMVSPTAVFWGGAHRFMIEPRCYPYHDGGWRDNFMKKLYLGKLLGKDGAIATAGQGISKMIGAPNVIDASGRLNTDNLMNGLEAAGGTIMGMLAGALDTLSSAISIPSLSDWLSGASSWAGEKAGKNKEKGKEKFGNLFTNLLRNWHNRVIMQTTLPLVHGIGALLIGEPVGEWHLTVGNPLNPMAVIGNLICKDMQVQWNDELGPDDFPTGFTVTYTLEHGMARDKHAILSMFNRGMGKYYSLPDYVSLSSDMETTVDKYTGVNNPDQNNTVFNYMSAGAIWKEGNKLGTKHGLFRTLVMDGGTPLKNSGNADTRLITKFTPVNSYANRTMSDIKGANYINGTTMSRIKSLAATRKKSTD